MPEGLPGREELRFKLRHTCASVDGAFLPMASRSPEDAAAGPSGVPAVPAAVLVGLIPHPEGPGVILTERAAHLGNHPAEISLPGGRVEPGDQGPAATALRETFEEIGLEPGRVELLGCLSPQRTISGFEVYPYVGWIEPPVSLVPDRREVADIFEVPLGFVVDPANHRREAVVVEGRQREFYVLPYPGRRIWGVTAGILVSLAKLLAW